MYSVTSPSINCGTPEQRRGAIITTCNRCGGEDRYPYSVQLLALLERFPTTLTICRDCDNQIEQCPTCGGYFSGRDMALHEAHAEAGMVPNH